MTMKTKVLLCLGAIFAAFSASAIAGLFVSRDWVPIVGVSALFAFFAFAFNSAAWAVLSVPAFVVAAIAINAVRLNSGGVAGIAAAVVIAVLVNAAVLLVKRRRRAEWRT